MPNTGQEHPSAAIRTLTTEGYLAVYRLAVLAFTVIGVPLICFFLMRLININDENVRAMEAFRVNIQAQVATIREEAAKNNSAFAATMAAVQDRMNAHSNRMDGFGTDIRDINKRMYEWRARGNP